MRDQPAPPAMAAAAAAAALGRDPEAKAKLHQMVAEATKAAKSDGGGAGSGSSSSSGGGGRRRSGKRSKSIVVYMAAVVKPRKGWTDDGSVEDPADAPFIKKRFGFLPGAPKVRYPVPADLLDGCTCSGPVVVSRRPVKDEVHHRSSTIKWKQRWMVVKNNKAYLFKRRQDVTVEATNIIKLDDCVVGVEGHAGRPRAFCVSPPPGCRTETSGELAWIVEAPSDAAKIFYMAAIVQAASLTERTTAEAGRVPIITLEGEKEEEQTTPPAVAIVIEHNNTTDAEEPSSKDGAESVLSSRSTSQISTRTGASTRGEPTVLFPLIPRRDSLATQNSIESVVLMSSDRFFQKKRRGSRAGSLLLEAPDDSRITGEGVPGRRKSVHSPRDLDAQAEQTQMLLGNISPLDTDHIESNYGASGTIGALAGLKPMRHGVGGKTAQRRASLPHRPTPRMLDTPFERPSQQPQLGDPGTRTPQQRRKTSMPHTTPQVTEETLDATHAPVKLQVPNSTRRYSLGAAMAANSVTIFRPGAPGEGLMSVSSRSVVDSPDESHSTMQT